jgi:signal transduction histidine kinase
MSTAISARAAQYAGAIAFTGIALALKLLLVPLLTQDAPFLLFFASAMLSASFGGLGPGIVSTALAAVLDNYFFMSPYHTLELPRSHQQLQLSLFIVEGIFISVICAKLKSAHRRVEASALEARELERRILEISDAEQRRIGHDLHDGLGQHLTGIALLTRRLEQRLAACSAPHADDASRLCCLAQSAVEWTHDLARSLSPPVLESRGLAEALRELASHTESLFDVECTFEQPDEGLCLPDPAPAGHLYRIAQEAISNAVKQGRAKHLLIQIEGNGEKNFERVMEEFGGLA